MDINAFGIKHVVIEQHQTTSGKNVTIIGTINEAGVIDEITLFSKDKLKIRTTKRTYNIHQRLRELFRANKE